MPERIEIPEALAAEVREHPERFQPLNWWGQEMLVLTATDSSLIGSICKEKEGESTLYLDDQPVDEIAVEAWVLVGDIIDPDNAHPYGPRPEPGERVLIIADGRGGIDVGRIGIAGEYRLAGWLDVEFEEDPGSANRPPTRMTTKATRWALLPPAEVSAVSEAADPLKAAYRRGKVEALTELADDLEAAEGEITPTIELIRRRIDGITAGDQS